MKTPTLAEIRSWIAGSPLTLLVFTTPECGVCDALKPRVAEIAQEYERLDVRYVDATASPEIAGQYGVFAVPVYVLSVSGKETVRFSRHFGIGELEGAVARYDGLLDSA